MATEVGNIHIGLYVDVGESRRFSDVANIVERDSRRMNSALGNTTNSVRALRSQMNQSLRFRIAQDSLRNLSQATNEIARLRAAMLGLAAITGTGVTGAFSAAYLVQTADKARLLANQIRTVTSDTAEFATVQDQLFSVSQRTRSSLEATTQIYARTARATEQYRYSQEKLLRVTETIQKAFAIGGATPQEATGAAIQLSQGIASDRFSGEEFRSVAENAPVLLRGMAESLGVNIGKLREMAHAGKLTANTVVDAIVKASDRIDREFGMTIPTVAQSFTLLDNAFVRYVGTSDEAYGVTKTLSTAIMGLAENFEDVMYWVTRGTAALIAFYGARRVVSGVRGKISDIQETNEQLREQAAKRIDASKEMAARLIEIEKEIAQARASVADTVDTAAARRSNQIVAAEQKQVDAVRKVNQLQAERNNIVNRLKAAQADEVNTLRQQVEVARQRVRDDQLRVIQAQEAAAAEERNLRARQAQALAKVDQTIARGNDRVFQGLERVGQAEAAIRAEKELAKTKIAGEIDTRRQALVTHAQRLRNTQQQIAELRSVQDLGDFEKVFGSQYRTLLREQQKAMASTKALHSEIGNLEEQMRGIDSGAASTKGITAAMTRHAQAVKQAELAVQSLAKVEQRRNEIAGAEVKGKTLEARLAAESREIERYQQSVNDLQKRMGALREATAGAFSGTGVQKIIREIDAFDKKIIATQNNLKAATASVMAAQADGGEAWATSLQAQARASEQVNRLQQEAAVLIERQTVNTAKLIAAQQRLNVLRRIGGGVLDFFGGWTGLALTGALMGASLLMGKFALEAQKSAEETERITKQLTDMGYLTGSAADEMGRFQENVAKGRMSKLQLELDAFNKDVKSTIKTLKDIDVGEAISESFGSFEVDTGDVNVMKRAFESFYNTRKNAVDTLTDDLTSIRDEMVKNRSMSDDMRKALEDMALANPDLASVVQMLVQMGERLNALRDATKDWTDSIKKAREEAEKNPQQRFGEYLEEEARIRAKYDQGVARVADPAISESAMTEYESQIKKTMDTLIKKAKELGETMLESDARRTAEVIYANEISKKGLRDLIGLYEGTDKGRGYNETLDYGKYTGGDVNLTSMTLREVLELQRKMLAHPDNDKNSSAVGRYQIVSQTLKGLIQQLGLSLETVFTPELQDRLADQLIRGRGRDAAGLRNEWEGLRNAPDQQILSAFDQTSTSLPRMDESTQKWIDGIKDLNLQKQIAGLKEFDKQVLQTAQSMGASNEELQAYIDAAKSGNMDQVPEKFRQIVSAMKDMETVEIAKQFKELQTTNSLMFLSDVDQKVVEMARSFGIAEDRIRAFIQAARAGDEVPATFSAIREEMQRMTYDQSLVEFADGAAEAFGGLISDFAHGEDALKNFILRLADLALEIFVIQPIIDGLKSSFRGLAADTAGGGSGGWFGSILKIFGFAGGGWTGPGAKNEPKGVVHGDEYVFSKEAVDKAGVAELDMLHQYLKTGNFGAASMSLPGYMNGGYVSSMRLPKYDTGGFVNDNSVAAGMAESLRKRETGVTVMSEVVVRMEDDEKFHAYVERTSTKAADRRVRHYDATLPGRIEAIDRHPRRRTNPVK